MLAREVVREYRRSFAHLPVTVLDTAFTSPREVWDELLSQPAGGRVTIVHGAGQAADPEMLKVLLGEASVVQPVVFVTSDPAWTKNDGQHLAVIGASRHGQVIRCVPPSKEEDLVSLVSSWWPEAGNNAAAEVLQRCGGSLALAREACEKAVLAGIPVTALSLVCRRLPGDEYADLVVAGDRKAAVTAACDVPEDETGRVLGLLALYLSALTLLNAARRQGIEPKEQALRVKNELGLKTTHVPGRMRPYAGSYPAERERQCRILLAMAETYHRAGASAGVLEAVAALW